MNKDYVIDEVLNETRIKKVSEAYTAMRVIWDNIDKADNMRELINEGDKRWNTETSKYARANYEKLVELTKEAIRRFESETSEDLMGELLFRYGNDARKRNLEDFQNWIEKEIEIYDNTYLLDSSHLLGRLKEDIGVKMFWNEAHKISKTTEERFEEKAKEYGHKSAKEFYKEAVKEIENFNNAQKLSSIQTDLTGAF